MVAINRNEKHSFAKESRMYISALLCSFLMLIEGTYEAWTSPLLKKLNGTEDNPLGTPLTESEYSLISSLGIPGSLIGALIIGATTNKIGRKPLLTILAFPSLCFFLTMAFTKTLWTFIIARVIQGIGLGGVLTIVSMYICEISEPEVRGTLIASIIVFSNLGQLITFCLGPYMPFKWYHISMSLFPLLFITLFHLFGIESPYYLVHKDPEEAERVLKILKGSTDVSEKFNEIKGCLNKTDKGTFMDLLKTRGTRKAFLIGLGISAFGLLTGETIIMAYATFIFDEAGGSWSGEIETIAIGVVQLVSSLGASTITDKFGRKPLMTISYIGVALSQAVLGYYLMLKDNGTDLSKFGWLPMLCLTGYVVASNIGNPIRSAIMGEIFPLRVKVIAISCCAILMTSFGFVARLLFQSIIDSIGLGQTFMLFAASGVLASIFVMAIVVETRGKTLEEVQDKLNGIKKKNLS